MRRSVQNVKVTRSSVFRKENASNYKKDPPLLFVIRIIYPFKILQSPTIQDTCYLPNLRNDQHQRQKSSFRSIWNNTNENLFLNFLHPLYRCTCRLPSPQIRLICRLRFKQTSRFLRKSNIVIRSPLHYPLLQTIHYSHI